MLSDTGLQHQSDLAETHPRKREHIRGKSHLRVLLSFNSCKLQLPTPHMEAVQNHLTYLSANTPTNLVTLLLNSH